MAELSKKIMTTYSDDYIFNLKAVVQETGLKPDTLRAWERRYGLPVPKRSSGKHRLYTQHDIDTLKWLMARQEEGVTIKRAVERWRTIESEGQNPLVVMPLAVPEATGASAYVAIGGDTLNDMRQAWIDACLAFDEPRANALLSQAFAMHTQETVVFEIIRHALVRVGEGWHQGTVTVQQEHFTSELATRQIEALIAAAALPSRPERIVVGCPQNELHAFPALLLTFLLRRHGWQTIFLGANIPSAHFQTAVTQTKPNLVILAAQLLSSAASLPEMAEILRAEGIPMAYGGAIFAVMPELRTRFQGTYLGDSLDSVAVTVENVFAAPQLLANVIPSTKEARAALAHYREQAPLINAHVWRTLRPNGVPPTAASIATANSRLAANICAALKLGDINYLGSDFSWQQLWVDEHDLPNGALIEYLQVYTQAATVELDQRGAPILGWLEMINARIVEATIRAELVVC